MRGTKRYRGQNRDNENAAMSGSVPYTVSGLSLQRAALKTLLLQRHYSTRFVRSMCEAFQGTRYRSEELRLPASLMVGSVYGAGVIGSDSFFECIDETSLVGSLAESEKSRSSCSDQTVKAEVPGTSSPDIWAQEAARKEAMYPPNPPQSKYDPSRQEMPLDYLRCWIRDGMPDESDANGPLKTGVIPKETNEHMSGVKLPLSDKHEAESHASCHHCSDCFAPAQSVCLEHQRKGVPQDAFQTIDEAVKAAKAAEVTKASVSS